MLLLEVGNVRVFFSLLFFFFSLLIGSNVVADVANSTKVRTNTIEKSRENFFSCILLEKKCCWKERNTSSTAVESVSRRRCRRRHSFFLSLSFNLIVFPCRYLFELEKILSRPPSLLLCLFFFKAIMLLQHRRKALSTSAEGETGGRRRHHHHHHRFDAGWEMCNVHWTWKFNEM